MIAIVEFHYEAGKLDRFSHANEIHKYSSMSKPFSFRQMAQHCIAKDSHYTLVNPETCPFLNRLRDILEGINLNATWLW